jgi:hypothetical protein
MVVFPTPFGPQMMFIEGSNGMVRVSIPPTPMILREESFMGGLLELAWLRH